MWSNRKYILYKFELRRGAEDGDEQPREAVQGGGGQESEHHPRTAWALELEMKVMRSLAKISITDNGEGRNFHKGFNIYLPWAMG